MEPGISELPVGSAGLVEGANRKLQGSVASIVTVNGYGLTSEKRIGGAIPHVKLLYFHGWNSVVGGVKPTYLRSHGHEVVEPALDHEDFQAAVKTAQAAFDQHQPDVVVGSSRGGAVAININSGSACLVLICPAWKKWGTAKTVKPGTRILHSRADDVVPFKDSVELLSKSGLPVSALIEVGQDHRLADPESLEALLRAVERRKEPS